MRNPRPIEFFKSLKQYGKFERDKIVYNFTDNFNPFLAESFFEEYNEYKLNLGLDMVKLSGSQKNYTPPIETDEGDYIGFEFSFDIDDASTDLMEQIAGTMIFDPQAENMISRFIADTETEDPNPFKNNFDDVPESKLFDYFIKNLVDKKYLSEESLTLYLKQAFELKAPPSKRFSFDNMPTQDKIRKIFYEYYKTTAGKPNGKKRAYVELLGEYFNGFDSDKIDTNFSK